jgi:hypothetical protein
MAEPMFWIALVCQLIIVIGYFWFYRKEQLCESLNCTRCDPFTDMLLIQPAHKSQTSNSLFYTPFMDFVRTLYMDLDTDIIPLGIWLFVFFHHY